MNIAILHLNGWLNQYNKSYRKFSFKSNHCEYYFGSMRSDGSHGMENNILIHNYQSQYDHFIASGQFRIIFGYNQTWDRHCNERNIQSPSAG